MIREDITRLVQLAQSGDRQAYGELVVQFERMVYAQALVRLRNATEAQELTQEVFVHAMTRLVQLKEPLAFPGWLRQIAVRMAVNRIARRPPVVGGEDETLRSAVSAGQSPLDCVLRAEACDQLHAGLRQLKPMDRATLEDFYIRGRSLKQISQEQSAPIGTIKRRLHTARRRLREHLEAGVVGTETNRTSARRPTSRRAERVSI